MKLNTPPNNKSASVSLIIVNWNGGPILENCLTHVLSQTVLPDKILVMDNASIDGSFEITTRFNQIEGRKLGNNLGFAAANNLALSECDTEYVALLNPDAFPSPDWLERLLDAANSYPQVSAFASLQLSYDKPDFVDGTGDVYHISGLVWRGQHNEPYIPSAQKCKPVFSPCAAAVLFRRQTLVSVGGFDEDFFCYVEDVDLGFRLRLAGYQSMYVPDAIVRHIGSASTGGRRSDFSVYYGHRNLVWTFIKDMPGCLFWALLPLHLVLNVLTILYFTFSGQGKTILRSKWDAMKGIPKMWPKRRLIQSTRIATIREIWQLLDKRLIPVITSNKKRTIR